MLVFVDLPPNSQPHFQLTRVIARSSRWCSCDCAPRAGVVDIEICRRIIGLEVIEDVSEQGIESYAYAFFSEFRVFGDRGIEVPARKSRNSTGTTTIGIDAEDQPPEAVAYRLRVGKGIDAELELAGTILA